MPKKTPEPEQAPKADNYAKINMPAAFLTPHDIQTSDGRTFEKCFVSFPKGTKVNGIDVSGFSTDVFLSDYMKKDMLENLTTYHTVCNECKQVIDGKADDHIKQTGHSGYSTNVPITDEVMVSEGYDKQVTDTPAYDETVIDKLVCTTCGATKDAPQATSDAAK